MPWPRWCALNKALVAWKAHSGMPYATENRGNSLHCPPRSLSRRTSTSLQTRWYKSLQSPPRVPLQGTFPQLPHPSSLCMAKYMHIREVVHRKGNFTWTISQVEYTTAIWMKPSTKWSTGAGHLYCGVPNLRNQVFPPENFGHQEWAIGILPQPLKAELH